MTRAVPEIPPRPIPCRLPAESALGPQIPPDRSAKIADSRTRSHASRPSGRARPSPMSPDLEFTGERFVPGIAGEIAHEHWHRYAVRAAACRGPAGARRRVRRGLRQRAAGRRRAGRARRGHRRRGDRPRARPLRGAAEPALRAGLRDRAAAAGRQRGRRRVVRDDRAPAARRPAADARRDRARAAPGRHARAFGAQSGRVFAMRAVTAIRSTSTSPIAPNWKRCCRRPFRRSTGSDSAGISARRCGARRAATSDVEAWSGDAAGADAAQPPAAMYFRRRRRARAVGRSRRTMPRCRCSPIARKASSRGWTRQAREVLRLDALLRNRDAALDRQTAHVHHLEALVAERERIVVERDAQLGARSSASSRDDLARQRNTLEEERDELTGELATARKAVAARARRMRAARSRARRRRSASSSTARVCAGGSRCPGCACACGGSACAANDGSGARVRRRRRRAGVQRAGRRARLRGKRARASAPRRARRADRRRVARPGDRRHTSPSSQRARTRSSCCSRNAENLGFTGTANRGMQLSRADVVLLNSDTDRHARLARRASALRRDRPDDRHASRRSRTTPRSARSRASARTTRGTRATIPSPCARRSRRRRCRRIPTCRPASGFCLYVRRALIDAIGTFDPAFGLGYGEENDLCLRAARAGCRNVLCRQRVRRAHGRPLVRGPEGGARPAQHGAAARAPSALPRHGPRVHRRRSAAPAARGGGSAHRASRRRRGAACCTSIHHHGGGTETHVRALIDGSRDALAPLSRHRRGRSLAGRGASRGRHASSRSTSQRGAHEPWRDFLGGICATFGIALDPPAQHLRRAATAS